LAIAVDNLADAESLSDVEKEEEGAEVSGHFIFIILFLLCIDFRSHIVR